MTGYIVLEEIDRTARDASRLTDDIRSRIAHGDHFEALIDELSACVNRISTLLPECGELPQPAAGRLAELASKVFGTTAAVEANRQAVAFEIESIARQERVRRTYARPAG